MEHLGLALADYLVFAATVCVCIGIGLHYACTGGQHQSTTDYLLGNRRLQMVPVAFSLVVSFESSILMLGFPAETYVYGAFLIWDIAATGLAMILVGARIAAPLFHPLKITSVYEYMEERFKSKGPRTQCTLMGMLFFLFYMGIVLYGPALAIQAVMQISLSLSIVLVAVVAMVYTALGGIKAVVWTDVLQSLMMTVGMIAIIWQCASSSGGLKAIFEKSKEYKRLDILDFRVDPTIRHTTWNMLFGCFVRAISIVFNQASIQRISTVRTLQEAKSIFYIAGLLFFIFGILINIEGLATFAYFNTIQCDPLEARLISNPNQIVPYMVTRIFRNIPGMSGLFMAALFSAALSTLSSGLNSLCAQFTEDFVKPNFQHISDGQTAVIAKLSVLVFGSLSVGISFMIANLQGSLMQFSGPVTGMFLYAIFCPWATKQGAMIGGLFSMVFVLWLSLGQNFSTTLIKQPWMPHNPLNKCQGNDSVLFILYNQSIELDFDNMQNRSFSFSYKPKAPAMEEYEGVINNFWNYERVGLDKLYAISYTWFASLAVLTVIAVGSIVSFVIGYPGGKEIDVRHVLPIGDRLFPYLPERAKRFLDFGVRFYKRKQWLCDIRRNEILSKVPGQEEDNV